MKKFSRLNFLNKAIIGDSGEVLNGLFSSKYAKLDIKLPEYDFKRGKVLVGDINRWLDTEDEKLTITELINLLYENLLKDIITNKEHHFIENIAYTYMEKKRNYPIFKKKEVLWPDQNHPYPPSKPLNSNDRIIVIPIKILKESTLRGEVFLHDMYEAYSEFNVTLEEIITIHYIDVMSEIKKGNNTIVRSILKNLTQPDRV
ncbi:hypothetical protein [Chengkuizengella axinellae]|uniref:Uncharacterized protein n=1 Tax=Chengkuizengella axinellae TaxID=3064388 RepID=A0ABT9J3A5_9BACL|nr:hypothetical protein [Chengkuizengella sp. 2205SS18-9]MDP5276100.1 hypothetical protein [Chengkuizengella sp. 2205SS18-9]